VSLYLDAGVLVALPTQDPLTERAELLLRGQPDTLVLSDFAAAGAFPRRLDVPFGSAPVCNFARPNAPKRLGPC